MRFIEHILQHTPAIFVLLPILSGVCVICLQDRNFGRISMILSNAILLILCCILLGDNEYTGKFYVFGGWSDIAGIEFKEDFSALAVLSIVYAVSLLYSIFSFQVLRSELSTRLDPKSSAIPYGFFLISNASAAGLILSNDFFNIFVFMEIGAISAYCLYSIGGDKKSYVSCFNYLLLCSIATTITLISIGFILSNFGCLNIDLVATQFNKHPASYRSIAALFLIGLAIKLAAFPFHSWKTQVYEHCSIAITSFMLPISAIPIVIVLFKMRFFINAFNNIEIIYIFSSITIISSAIASLSEKRFVRLVTYSSISSAGYFILLWAMIDHSISSVFFSLLVMDSLIKLGLLLIPLGLFDKDLHVNDIRLVFRGNSSLLDKMSFCAMIALLFNAASLPPSMLFFFKVSIVQEIFKVNIIIGAVILISSVAWIKVYTKIFINMMSPTMSQKTNITSKPVNKLTQIGIVVINLLILLLTYHHEIFSCIELKNPKISCTTIATYALYENNTSYSFFIDRKNI